MTYLCALSRQSAVWFLATWLAAASAAATPEVPGVPNFQKVNEQVYRGAQPTELGFQSLAKLGIRTIIDLRSIGEHSQAEEQRFVEGNGMRYVSVPMKGMSTPSDQQISKVLALMEDPAAGPVFVHCRRGADRAGTVIACYRISHDHWDNKKALKEARSYGMSWYQRALQNYVIHFQPFKTPATPAEVATSPGSINAN